MKVVWNNKARQQWQDTALYILREWGYNSMKKFRKQMSEVIEKLRLFPEIGHLESLLEGRSNAYRSLSFAHHNKLIYFTKEDTLYIVAFWDTRREPSELARAMEN